MAGHKAAVRIDGVVTVHMIGAIGDYDTLCGLDAHDGGVGHEPADVPRNGRARIDCNDCKRIWDTARSYTPRDFKLLQGAKR